MNRSGYIAIVSALLIALGIAVLVSVAGIVSFLGRQEISDASFKERSRGLAESCVQIALLRLAEDPAYAGNETVPVDDEECRIVSVLPGTERIISVRAGYEGAWTSLRVAATATEIVEWEEPSEL